MAKKKKKGGNRTWRFIRRLLLLLFISHLLYIVLLRWVNPPITLTQLGSWISGDGLRRDYIEDDALPYNLKLAVIASEDQLYPDHGGFDWKSIEKAVEYNKKKPNRVRGASTISQQVAKNVFLWQGRSWIRKGLEIYFTKMIEWTWGKKRILSVYLNVIEMGKGIYGAEAASQYYFRKPASKLSRKEAALIAACLPNPKRFTPQPASHYVNGRSNWIVQQMRFLETDPDVVTVIRNRDPKPAGKPTPAPKQRPGAARPIRRK
ncbi:MAG: Biosynthetic peptidoglycan transglycosylase [Flaviaesturariibacter sp.]|nr:Biosynthetic peptidoglycan transglycosylase [Flaviaesturariibacter sp.]